MNSTIPVDLVYVNVDAKSSDYELIAAFMGRIAKNTIFLKHLHWNCSENFLDFVGIP